MRVSEGTHLRIMPLEGQGTLGTYTLTLISYCLRAAPWVGVDSSALLDCHLGRENPQAKISDYINSLNSVGVY